MADEITFTPRVTAKNGSFIKGVGMSFLNIDQAVQGAASESKKIPNTTPVAIDLAAGMTMPGVCLLSNLSAKDSGDDELILTVGGVDAIRLKPGEQFPFRMVPAGTYAVKASGTTGCDYSLTIFED